ncbi:MAG: hypothetical protein AAFX05_11315 [Planctomycetota bacterium]
MSDNTERMLDDWGTKQRTQAAHTSDAFVGAVARVRGRRRITASAAAAVLLAVAAAVFVPSLQPSRSSEDFLADARPIEVRLDICRPTLLTLSRATFDDSWEEPEPCDAWTLAWAHTTPALP